MIYEYLTQNNIDPKIIGGIDNLEFIPAQENVSKQHRCSVTKHNLLTTYYSNC